MRVTLWRCYNTTERMSERTSIWAEASSARSATKVSSSNAATSHWAPMKPVAMLGFQALHSCARASQRC